MKKTNVHFLYRLDPRTKLLLVILFAVVICLVDSLICAAVLMLGFLLIAVSARIQLKKIFPNITVILFILLFVLALQVIFERENGLANGFIKGITLDFRIIALSILMPILTVTTETRLLSYGITRLGLNYKTAYIITSALNMIPLFETQTAAITEACKLRGNKFLESKNIFIRLKEYSLLVIPLMIKAMRHAVEMGLVMDARAFGAYRTRIWLIKTRFSFIDFFSISSGIILSAGIITANYCINW